jgi:hypothetical protein
MLCLVCILAVLFGTVKPDLLCLSSQQQKVIARSMILLSHGYKKLDQPFYLQLLFDAVLDRNI